MYGRLLYTVIFQEYKEREREREFNILYFIVAVYQPVNSIPRRFSKLTVCIPNKIQGSNNLS